MDDWSLVESAEEYGFRGEVRVEEYVGEHENPRNYDNLSVMVCEHRNYTLGDTTLRDLTGYDLSDFSGRNVERMKLIEWYIRRKYKARAFTWMMMYDHSGLHIYAGISTPWYDSAGWDSGVIGFAFVGEEQVKKMGYDGATDEELSERMHQEIETYDAYVQGEVYYWIVKDRDGDVVEGVSGYVGDREGAEKEMKESLATEVKRYKKEQWEQTEIDNPPELIGIE